MNIFWYILIGLSVAYLGYVLWVIIFWKGPKKKKHSKNLAYLHINDKFVDKSSNEQADMGAVLDQMSEVENTSKLLEAFKEGSLEDTNSLTRKKHEKFKIIRNTDAADEHGPDPKT